MPVHGAEPINWAVQVAAIPRQRNAWPRCAAWGDFASRIHSPGRPTEPPPGAGIVPTRQGAIGAPISAQLGLRRSVCLPAQQGGRMRRIGVLMSLADAGDRSAVRDFISQGPRSVRMLRSTVAIHRPKVEKTMISTTLRIVLAHAILGITAAVLASTAATAQNQNMEVIHHPNYDKNVFMPFVPAIKIKSGKILWLAGTTALPVYHDHPHKRDQIQQYMVNDLEAQTRAAMDGIKQTLDAAGSSFKDVVHYFVFRARPRMGDIGKASAVINSYFAPFNHKPTSTNIAVLELGEPEQLIEIQMVAVVD